MTDIVEFPVCAVRITDRAMAFAYDSRPGHEATNGMRRAVGLTSARMKLYMTILVRNADDVRTMRGLLWKMEGNNRLVRINIPDLYNIDGRWAASTARAKRSFPSGVPFASDALYSTGVGHAYPLLSGLLSRSAGLNAREILLTCESDFPGGVAISIDEFCYGVSGSWLHSGGELEWDDGESLEWDDGEAMIWSDPIYRCEISPPLRKAAGSGGKVQFAPVFVGTCSTETPGYEALRLGRYGEHTLEFIEDLTRLYAL